MTPQQFNAAAELMSERDGFRETYENASTLAATMLYAMHARFRTYDNQLLKERYPRLYQLETLVQRTIENQCERSIAEIEAEIAKI